jgi:transcriptional regulator with XRE-family HTH domain
MDVEEVLRTARARAGISQAELARRAGTDRAQVSRYESGRASPTLSTLSRLLATMGLQVRAALVPLMAGLDAQVDQVLTGEVELVTDELPNLMLTLDDDPAAEHGQPYGRRPRRRGPVTWAFDGHTALQLQGLAFPGREIVLAVVLDDAARAWLEGIGAMGYCKGIAVNWMEDEADTIAAGTSDRFFARICMLTRLRLVDELPPTLRLEVPWCDRTVPVATVDAVESAHLDLAEVLARVRQRRR